MGNVKTFDDNLLLVDCKKIRAVLVGFLSNEIKKIGLSKGIIGLSGGVDSALSAALAAEALGPDNVIGVILPYRTSNPDSKIDALTVAEHLGIRTLEFDITPMVDVYIEQLETDIDKLRSGNLMARQRMIVLYDISQQEGALVIGTSNRTEMLLGYSTIFGDSASALNPLGDLLKTQVWQLAKEIDLPQQVVDKKPSADLWQGQTDEEDLGFDYLTADKIITLLVDQRLSPDTVINHGFSRETVESIIGLIRKSQFKRMPPIIAKLSHRTINKDFRYPRDWGL